MVVVTNSVTFSTECSIEVKQVGTIPDILRALQCSPCQGAGYCTSLARLSQHKCL